MIGRMNDNGMVFHAAVDGEMKQFEVLFTFEYERTGRSYMAYTDGSRNENGDIQVYASVFTELGDNQCNLEQIESEREWEMIETTMEIVKRVVRTGEDVEAELNKALEEMHARWDFEDSLKG